MFYDVTPVEFYAHTYIHTTTYNQTYAKSCSHCGERHCFENGTFLTCATVMLIQFIDDLHIHMYIYMFVCLYECYCICVSECLRMRRSQCTISGATTCMHTHLWPLWRLACMQMQLHLFICMQIISISPCSISAAPFSLIDLITYFHFLTLRGIFRVRKSLYVCICVCNAW